MSASSPLEPATSRAPARARSGVLGLVWALVTVIVMIAIGTVRVVVRGEDELAESDAALKRGDARQALVHTRRAAAWYAPGAAHVGFAYRRLIALAEAAEQHHRRELALLSWYAVRQASLDSRWLVTPHATDRERAEREIARISAMQSGWSKAATEGGTEPAVPDPVIEARMLASLRKDERPRLPWVIVLCAGLGAAATGVATAARKSAGPGRVDWRRGRAGLLVAAAGGLAWLIALWQA